AFAGLPPAATAADFAAAADFHAASQLPGHPLHSAALAAAAAAAAANPSLGLSTLNGQLLNSSSFSPTLAPLMSSLHGNGSLSAVSSASAIAPNSGTMLPVSVTSAGSPVAADVYGLICMHLFFFCFSI